MLPWIGEERHDAPHPYVVSEWHTEWGFTLSPGRMVRTPRLKYTRYLEGAGEELYFIAERDGTVLGTDDAYLHAAPSDDEYFDAARRTSLLERVAEETGGRFYTPESVSTLPEDITISGAGVTLVEEHDLWDMPVIFLALLLLMGAEWGFRRVRGLV